MEDIKKDITNLYAKIDNSLERITKLEASTPFLQQLLERNVTVCEKLSDTLNEVKCSMVEMNEKMDAQSQALESMRQDFETNRTSNENKFNKIEDKIENLDQAGQYDMRDFMRRYFPWIVVLLGFGILYASQYFKF